MDDKTREDFLNFNPLLQAELAERFPELKPLLKECLTRKDRLITCRPGGAISYKEVNDSLSIEEVAKHLGLDVEKHFCSCPFHCEKTPSMKLYERNYHCFGCGASGDSIDLASKFLGIRPAEAVAVLNEAFHLGYDLNKKPSHKQIRTRKIEALKKDLYQEWHEQATLLMSSYIHACYDVANATTSDPLMKTQQKTEAERVELLQESMFETSPQNAWLLYRKEVAEIDKRMQRRDKQASGDRI